MRSGASSPRRRRRATRRPAGSAPGRRLGPHGRRSREPAAPGLGAGQARRHDLRAGDPAGPRPDRRGGPTCCSPATSTPRMRRRSRRSTASSGPGRGVRGRAARPSPMKVLPAGPVLRDGAEAAREGPGGGGGADAGLRHAGAAAARCLSRSTASTTINTSFVERNNGTDRHQNCAEASQDLRLLQGHGDAPRGVLLHRVQLQLLLAGADVASRR